MQGTRNTPRHTSYTGSLNARFRLGLSNRQRPHSMSHRLPACLLLFALSACAASGEDTARGAGAAPLDPPAPIAAEVTARPDAIGIVDYSCHADADCAVKNIGNCCGYSPACVNKDSATFPEQVKAQCQREGVMAICGFREIAACTCNQGRCEATPDPVAEPATE